MKIGKLPVEKLENLVLKNIKNIDSSIETVGKIGEDCSSIVLDDKVIYLTTDPITGSTKEIGKLIVNINSNDIATMGIKPLGIMLTILLPPETSENELNELIIETQKEAEKVGITILGGHTEVTDAVNKIVVSATAIGIDSKNNRLKKEQIKDGDKVLITKGIGIEGTGIITFEKENELKNFLTMEEIEEGKKLLEYTSVVKDGILAKEYVKSMHDITEGGILGAIWEIASLYRMGVKIYNEKIYMKDIVKKISTYYKIDPLRLISSGSMLMICDKEKVEKLMEKLKKNGIESYEIGELTEKLDKILIENGEEKNIVPPESDELYKVIG